MKKFSFLVALAACSNSSSPPGGGPPDGGGRIDAMKPPIDSSMTSTGQIKILSLTTTVSTVTGGVPLATESNSVTFVAIVTDTKGLDTIAGGQLVDDTGATYAAFEAGTNKGTYTCTLTYQQMNQIKAIDFPVGGGMVNFTAKFFDNDANVATSSLPVHLACRDNTNGLIGACGGSCSDQSIDPANCGMCGNPCAKGTYCAGTCQAAMIDGNNDTNCILTRSIDHTSTCVDICTAAGKHCVNSTTPFTGIELWTDLACTSANTNIAACGTQIGFTGYKSLACACSN